MLCNSSTDQDASEESLLVRQFEGERQSWDIRFFQCFIDWELGLVAAFLHLLDSHIPLDEDGDRRLKKNEEFDICSFYNALRGSNSVTFP